MVMKSTRGRCCFGPCGFLRVALLSVAGVIVLSSAADARGAEEGGKKEGRKAGQNMELRYHAMFKRIREYSSADADADGKVSRAERTAFLAALAMQSIEAVLKEHPAADFDENGELSVTEAFELVQGNRARADLRRRAKLEEEAEGLSETSAKEGKLRWREEHLALSIRTVEASEWLLDNMTEEPSRSRVAEYVKLAVRAEREEFLRKNPEADADGDGVLTAAEQEAFNEARWSKKLAAIRERIEEVEARLESPELGADQVREWEGRLKRLRNMEAEYAGALAHQTEKGERKHEAADR